MQTHEQRARALFLGGSQCAQSVFAALCDVTGMQEEDALALSASFGGGIGRTRETCGALCGLLMALGAVLGRYPRGDSEAKDRHYRLVQYAQALFKRRTGSVFCYELLELPHAAQIPVSAPRTEQFYKERPCEKIILAAVAVFDELMREHENGTLEQKITPEAAVKTTEYLNEQAAKR
jgi:C_GCAxxG_C_C family probable redox protein